MSRVDQFSLDIRKEVLLKYISSPEWSHRRLQKEVLDKEAPARGGGFLVLEILRYFGLEDSSLKGIFTKVRSADELKVILDRKSVPDITQYIVLNAYLNRNQGNTYLLNWNPEKWTWDTFGEELESFSEKGTLVRKWGCGNRKNIEIGDRLFFIRLGKDMPRGIMGSGRAVSGSYLSSHWSGEDGKKGLAVDIEFDVLLDPSTEHNLFLSYDDLIEDDVLKTRDWSNQVSGTVIKDVHAVRLEELWFSRFKETIMKQYKNTFFNGKIREGKKIQYISKRYERDSRARQLCLSLHGYSCKACEISFEEIYGTLGKNFIHVHHIIPIASKGGEYELDPAKDLIPLCPNCHAMIHRLPPPHSLEELVKILNRTGRNE